MSEAQLERVREELENVKNEVRLMEEAEDPADISAQVVEYLGSRPEPLADQGSNPWVGGGGGCFKCAIM
eukprot:CAMPEP_0175105132 /NCGR_PEP_ID=MMETSP0086_2-20121207/10230_1 /TAXON_ID=136419 /ORGANISM="Unknown Unknown, Strain D1" /LENGTH=68 /DNA_ID=CAMNT_0016380835 /DNA_START=19 /DNA_END=225 /DNA_ORIENTATION=-